VATLEAAVGGVVDQGKDDLAAKLGRGVIGDAVGEGAGVSESIEGRFTNGLSRAG
jgi:hypothetical protein